MNNKIRVTLGVEIIALVIWGLLTIATCAGVWNFCPEGAVKWFATALFLANGAAIFFIAKNLKKQFPADEV